MKTLFLFSRFLIYFFCTIGDPLLLIKQRSYLSPSLCLRKKNFKNLIEIYGDYYYYSALFCREMYVFI